MSKEQSSTAPRSHAEDRRFPAPLCSPNCAPVFEAADPPLWQEMSAGPEWLALHVSPVYYGCAVARGQSGPVIVVPGFLASDVYLTELYLWLRRIGFSPVLSDVGINADCPDVLLERLLETIDATAAETRRKVQIIGHSFGGVLARAAAQRRPASVSQVITLGAPLRALRAHRRVLAAAKALSAALPPPHERPRRHRDHAHATECACEFLHNSADAWPRSVRLVSLYSKSDGVVDWRTCLVDPPASNVEVHGSHIGMVASREVYERLAVFLAEGEGDVAAGRLAGAVTNPRGTKRVRESAPVR